MDRGEDLVNFYFEVLGYGGLEMELGVQATCIRAPKDDGFGFVRVWLNVPSAIFAEDIFEDSS